MDAYSMDLRVRIVQAYLAQDGSQTELAERFEVSDRWLRKLLCQERQTGSIRPLPHGGGRQRIVTGDKEDLLLKAIADTPDATLDELRERCGVNGSRMCIARALERLDITRKKSRLFARNNKTPKCKNNAKLGKGRSETLSQAVSSSSTKPTRKPRLPAFSRGRHAGNASGSTCPTDAGNR